MGEIICVIIMGVCLISWVVICVIWLFSDITKTFKQSDFTYSVTCNKCGKDFDAVGEDIKGIFYKQRSVTKTVIQQAKVIKIPHYKMYSRKIFCPYCNKYRWCQINNMAEARQNNIGSSMVLVGKTFLKIFIGGFIILALFQIPLAIL